MFSAQSFSLYEIQEEALRSGMATAAAAVFRTAGAAIRTPDTFFPALFRLVDIGRGSSENQHKYTGENEIHHIPLTPLRAYSRWRSLSALRHRYTRTAANTATAIRPGRKPAPSVPVVIRVPI